MKTHDFRQVDIEIRLLLRNNNIDEIVNVMREATVLNLKIGENVCILVARKIFELIEIKKCEIQILEEKELNAINIKKLSNLNNLNNILLHQDDQAILDKKENDKLESDLKIKYNAKLRVNELLSNLEEMTNNIVYCDRGGEESYCRYVRMWKEGGDLYKDKCEVRNSYQFFFANVSNIISNFIFHLFFLIFDHS